VICISSALKESLHELSGIAVFVITIWPYYDDIFNFRSLCVQINGHQKEYRFLNEKIFRIA